MEFLKLWEILSRKKWIFISAVLGFFSIVVIGTLLITPTYRAKSKLSIETSDTISSLLSSLGEGGARAGGVNPKQVGSDEYDTDIALVTIRPLLEKLIFSLTLKDRHGRIMKP